MPPEQQTAAAPTTTPNDGGATASAEPSTATAAVEEGQPPQASEAAAQGQQTTESGKPAGDEKPAGAPESYEFKAPEGVTLNDSVVAAFSDVAKGLNLPQDQAQQVIDKMGPAMAAAQLAQIEAVKNQWLSEVKADKDIGGDKLDASIALAIKTRESFGSPALNQFLNESGLGNHPEMVRFFHRVGQAISEDSFVSGKGGSTSAGASIAQRMYPGMNP